MGCSSSRASVSSLESSFIVVVLWSEEVFGAPRGAGETEAVGAWCGHAARDGFETSDQAVAVLARVGELAVQLAAELVVAAARDVRAEASPHLGQALGEVLDEVR